MIKQIEIDRQLTLDDAGVLDILQNKPSSAKSRSRFLPPMVGKIWHKKNNSEIDVISQFLPQPMSEAEIANLVAAEIAEQGATSMQQMGAVMNALKVKTAGQRTPL